MEASAPNEAEDSGNEGGSVVLGGGSDSYGRQYASVEEMWEMEGAYSDPESWYGRAADYWEDEDICPATVNGVLGGFESLSPGDLEASRTFLQELQRMTVPGDVRVNLGGAGTAACECGAGIGRVTKGLLLPLGYARCDLIELSPRLLSEAPAYIGDKDSHKCRYLCQSLQHFEPPPSSYDIIWIQWCIGYLTDQDCIQFLKRCGAALRRPDHPTNNNNNDENNDNNNNNDENNNTRGIICIKDNTCTDETFVLDRDDASITRSLPYLLDLAHKAGLKVLHQQTNQDDFPDDIFPVPMIALIMDDDDDTIDSITS
mmetsp:Transcript_21023/g.37978  ORF Transcript_21023/g.37978 Transcript_21023/m.37978 type:complete len:315 (-) Transcript_21023:74-1018(-)